MSNVKLRAEFARYTVLRVQWLAPGASLKKPSIGDVSCKRKNHSRVWWETYGVALLIEFPWCQYLSLRLEHTILWQSLKPMLSRG